MVTRQALSWALCLDGRASCQSSQKTVRYMTLALEWVRPQSILRRSCCNPHLHCRGSMTSCNLGPRWKALGRSQPLWRTSEGASPTRAPLPENCPQIRIIPLQWHRRIWCSVYARRPNDLCLHGQQAVFTDAERAKVS